MDNHLNLEADIKELIVKREQDLLNLAICCGDLGAMKRIEKEGSINANIDLNKETPLGQRQVESLLRLMVERPLEREIEDAELDNITYDGLGEHRILGRAKKKKKKKSKY